ncbi:mitogen-activated protein kinase kinase kinase 4 isoform X2 [Anabrus simplex]|uniref:mitogen-activated protein kinase kinase kinase 4 isoform X2 n=1 Tax=Anabrus simplex TaxID=316456 RepID=UPI0035A39E55
MADDDWKKRVGIQINFSSDEDEGGKVEYDKDLLDQFSTKQPDSTECSYDGSQVMEEELFHQFIDEYGSTPPRTRIRRKERRQREKEEQSITRNSPKIIHAKTKRRNTLDSIYFELLERSENSGTPSQEEKDPSLRENSKRNKRSMKLLRESERDIKLDYANVRYSMPPMLEQDDDRSESMPLIVPQPAIKVESCNRFMSLTSKLVACRNCVPAEEQPSTKGCSQDRVDFFNTFSILIRMGSSEKQIDKNPRRQLSKEEHRWQNELKDLIWLELQAWHADRTPTEQDAYLFEVRKDVEALLNEIMTYRFVKKIPPGSGDSSGVFSTQSSDSGVSSDDKEGCSSCDPCLGTSDPTSCYCTGCLSIYCHNCMESQVTALKEVEQLLSRLEAAEALYQSSKAFAQQYPVYKCPRFVARVKAMCLWYNMTKHHRLKLLILGKLLKFLHLKQSNWPQCEDDSSTSGVGTDTSASEDTSYQDISHLSRSSSVEGKYYSKHKSRVVQFDVDSSSPSDSNNSNISSHGTASDVAELAADTFDSRSLVNLTSQALCHGIKQSPRNPYRKYIEDVLKTRGLRKSVQFLEKLHQNILVKSMLSLAQPVDSPSDESWAPELSIDSVDTLREAPVTVTPAKLAEEVELRRYGYWSRDAQALNLPSYRSAFLFLCRVPLDTIHEFLRMRLEQRPDQPSVLCIRQLMRELKEGLRIALLHRQRYLHLVRTALWDVDKTILHSFEEPVVGFDASTKKVFEMYLDYLRQWVPLVQHERFQKNVLEEEWQFVKATCKDIPGAHALMGKSFCHIASGVLETIGVHLATRVKELIQQMQTGDVLDEDSSTKQVVMLTCREFQSLTNEIRERSLKAICFAKTIVKDLEKEDFVQDGEEGTKDVINDALNHLKQGALTLRNDIAVTIQAVEKICDEWDMSDMDDADRTALLARCREVLHLGYKFGFEYHKEIGRIVTGGARCKLSLGLISFAHQWMMFVKERCERGKGTRPRWANQGLDFLITVCEPQITCYLRDNEFEALKSCIDECISHVIGTAVPIQEKPPHFSHNSRNSLETQHSRSRGSSPCSRNKSPSYRTSRSLQDTSLTASVPVAQRSFSAQPSHADDSVDGDIVVTLDVPDRSMTRIERVQAAIRRLEENIENKLRSEELIGSVTEVESEDKIHIKSRSVTFTWQRGIKIGQGRFGKVYTAVNNKTGDLLAMKEIQLQPNDHRTIRKVAEELRTFEGITHPSLVRYYGVEIHRDEMLIFMEFCAEGTLESLVSATENGLPENLIRWYTHQLLDAVATLHSHGIVHRDIKTANIFLTDEGNRLKLGDFGSAVKIKAHTTMPGELQGFVGTQAYMAPEVFMKTNTEGHGRSADIWSVGCVVVEMASGKRPWAEFDSNYQIMFKVGMGETPKAPDSLCEDGHHFLSLCLKHDPRLRASAQDLLLHTFVKMDSDEEYLSNHLPSIFEDCFKQGPKR